MVPFAAWLWVKENQREKEIELELTHIWEKKKKKPESRQESRLINQQRATGRVHRQISQVITLAPAKAEPTTTLLLLPLPPRRQQLSEPCAKQACLSDGCGDRRSRHSTCKRPLHNQGVMEEEEEDEKKNVCESKAWTQFSGYAGLWGRGLTRLSPPQTHHGLATRIKSPKRESKLVGAWRRLKVKTKPSHWTWRREWSETDPLI